MLTRPIRLPDYAIGIFSTAPTKSAIKKALKKGRIKVNAAIATTATLLFGGEEITLDQLTDNIVKRQLDFPLQVLYEDEYLAAIYKPAGILVSGNSFKTISNALIQNLQRSSLQDAVNPQPVHRLDYATTGVLLIGKTQSSIQQLNQLFEKKEIQKTYVAVCIGSMPKKGSIIENIDGKKSHSDYQLIESVASPRFKALNLVQLFPRTGRRHQLRKHLSTIGNPILGDQDYGIDPLILKGQGLYLHAHKIEFTHPFTNKKMEIMADFTKRFKKLFKEKTNELS